jgi:hypothetical protein
VSNPAICCKRRRRVAESFQQVCAIRVAEVIISGVANIPYEACKMSHWEDPAYRDAGGTPESILKRAAAKSGLKWPGPALKEIVPYDGEALAEASPEDAFSKSVAMEETGDELILRGTKESLEKYGMVWSDGAYCFREDVYMSLRKYFDPDYFTSEHLKL